MVVTIKVKGLDRIKNLPRDMRDGLIKGMKLSVIFAEGEAKKNFGGVNQLKVRSGLLRNSIKSNVLAMTNSIVGTIGTNVIYAALHEYGGTIRPRAGNALRFQISGNWITTKSVTIPDRPFLTPAVEDNLGRISQILHDNIVEGGNRP